jgi:hypothetical protein
VTLPRTVAGVLADDVNSEVERIDRRCLNVHVPQLQYATGLSTASSASRSCHGGAGPG